MTNTPFRRYRRFPQEIKDQAVALYQEGHSPKHIFYETGYSQSALAYELKKRGIASKEKRHVKEEMGTAMTMEYAKGKSLKEVGAIFGFSASAVIRQLKKLRIERRPSGGTGGPRKYDRRLMGSELAYFEIAFAKGWNTGTLKELPHWRAWKPFLNDCKTEEDCYLLGLNLAKEFG